MKEYVIRIKTDFDFRVSLDFDGLSAINAKTECACLSVHKGEHHVHVESTNPLVYWEETIFVEYDRIIQLSFHELIHRIPKELDECFLVSKDQPDSRADLYGVVDIVSGNWFVPPKYQDTSLIELFNSKTDARFLIIEDNTLKLISNTGRLVDSIKYEGRLDLGHVFDFLIIVCPNQRDKGEELISVCRGIIESQGCYSSKDIKAAIDRENERRLCDSRIGDGDSYQTFEIDTTRNIIKKEKRDYCDMATSPFLQNERDVYDSIRYISDDWIEVKQNGKWGVINIKNEVVIPISYNSIGPIDCNPAQQLAAIRDGRMRFISNDGEERDFPLIEAPEEWCSVDGGRAIYYKKENAYYLKVLDKPEIRLSEYCHILPIEVYYNYDGEYMGWIVPIRREHEMVKYVKALGSL